MTAVATAVDAAAQPADVTPGPNRRHLWLLSGIVAVAAALYAVVAASGGYSDYYAAAAKSMSTNWTAFAFGAFDPGATITLDKLSGFLLPQAISVRLFGFSPVALAIPQILEGLTTITATYFVVRQWVGSAGGLFAAAAMALTPVLAATFVHPMEDAMLTMCTVLAVLAWQRTVHRDGLRWLLLAGVLVAVGFQAKMMQAWLVLPAMAVTYFVISTTTLGRRIRNLIIALGTTVACSFAWVTAIALVPPAARPFIDGTTNNNPFTMVIGYNGVNRFVAGLMPGTPMLPALPARASVDMAQVGLVPGLLGHTPLKFFIPVYAAQISWLFPLAAAGLVLAWIALKTGRPAVSDRRMLLAATLFSGVFVVTLLLVLGTMSLPHTAYLASMALPISGLSAIALVLLRKTLRLSSRLRFFPAIVAAVQTAWTVVLMTGYPGFAGWLIAPTLVIGSVVTIALLLIGRQARPQSRTARVAVSMVAVVAMLGPAWWSFAMVNPRYAGTANDAYAGPQNAQTASIIAPPEGPYGVGLDSNRAVPQTAALESAIYDFSAARAAGDRYVLAVDSWRVSAPLIFSDRLRVLPIGGFTSRVPSPDLKTLRFLIAAKHLRYVVLTGVRSKNDVVNLNLDTIGAWVRSTCLVVPTTAYRSASLATVSAPDRLYDCVSAAVAVTATAGATAPNKLHPPQVPVVQHAERESEPESRT